MEESTTGRILITRERRSTNWGEGKHSVIRVSTLGFLKRFLVVICWLLLAQAALAGQWSVLGPDGGNARSLTYDPKNPDRIFLGTSAGELFVSNDGGSSWSFATHLGAGFSHVLDHVVFDPSDSNTMYVAAWDADDLGGDLFRSHDGGKTWEVLSSAHGKSIRAMAVSPSNPKTIVFGALDGVYRSDDGGDSFRRISPANHNELKNFESIAVDPQNPDVVYAGTWHLPWKTEDGGRNWKQIKQGVIDDSDVFSIIVDPKNPSVVYASACSGIYRSESAGNLFHKIQGIPFSARRTRVLQQDLSNEAVVYAGTTEGVWRTMDSGKTWKQISSPSVVVNDIMVDPRNPARVLLATDRTGVLISSDNGATFRASNHGFVYRKVTAVVVDHENPSHIYVSVINDQEHGGVFMSQDRGQTWQQISAGLGGRDVFTLNQTANGELVAGTTKGVFLRDPKDATWKPINSVLNEKMVTVQTRPSSKSKFKNTAATTQTKREVFKGEISSRVSQVKMVSDHWYAAAAQGLFQSKDQGRTWRGGPVLGEINFTAVDAMNQTVVASNVSKLVLSKDGGDSWTNVQLPPYVNAVFAAALDPAGAIWITTRMGAFRSKNEGATWDHVMAGNPVANLSFVTYDAEGNKLVGLNDARNQIFTSQDGGETWKLSQASRWTLRNLVVARGRLFAATDFSGLVSADEESSADAPKVGGGGGSQR